MHTVRSAVKAIIQDKGRFLVIKQGVGESFVWDLPGGKVEFGESPFDTLKREVKEETDLDIEIRKPVGIWWFVNSKEDQIVCTTFLCVARNTNVDLTKNPADENIEEFRWVTKEEFLNDNLAMSNESFQELVSKIEYF